MSNPLADEYLQPDFDPNSLKVAQLRGILLENGVSFSGLAKKGELVQAFEENVKIKAPGIFAAASRVRASNKGFISVSEDGEEVPTNTSGAKRHRGRPRKTVQEPVDVEEIPEPEPEPIAKKPRSRSRKATDNVEVEIPSSPPKKRGRPKRSEMKHDDDTGAEAELEEDDATPVPRSTRTRGSVPTESPISVQSAPSSSRRRSVKPSSSSVASDLQPPSDTAESRSKNRKIEPTIEVMDELKEESEKEDEAPKKISKVKTPRRSTGEDSGFSDFNPFQSGSEEAAERERRRRKSSLGAQKSKPAQPRFSEPAPSTAQSSGLRRMGPSQEDLKTPPKEAKDALKGEKRLTATEEYNRANKEKLNQRPASDVEEEPQITIATQLSPPSTSLVKRVNANLPTISAPRSVIPLSALFLLLLSFLANFKNNSASLGYCDSNNNVNDIVLKRQSALDNANACIARRTHLDLQNPGSGKAIECDVSALPLVPFLRTPTQCAICPPHAICEDGKMIACEPEYLLSPHPLTVLSTVVDGLPGIGPRAFPPSCRPDTAKKRMIGGLAKEMERDLAKGRGLVACAGISKEDGRKGVGERFGMEEHAVKERFSARRDPKFSQEQFDEIFEAALKDLVEHDDVIESIDVNGRSWYAAARTDLTVGCRAKLEAVDLLERWKSQLASTAAVLAAIGFLRSQVKSRKEEKFQAEQLVHVVLKRLQDQEHLHYSDPVTTPNPFIPPAQLRDVVLPPTGSTSSRANLWQRVQDLVEANANVAVREREVRGEVWKTWEWQGIGERRVTWG